MAHQPWLVFILVLCPGGIRIWRCCFLWWWGWEREKVFLEENRSTVRETPRSKAKTYNKLNPDMAPDWAGELPHHCTPLVR